MYATINHWQLNTPVTELRASMEAELLPELSQAKGFKGMFFVKEADDRCAFIVLWESPEALESAQPALAKGWFGKTMFPRAVGAPSRSFGEVLVSR